MNGYKQASFSKDMTRAVAGENHSKVRFNPDKASADAAVVNYYSALNNRSKSHSVAQMAQRANRRAAFADQLRYRQMLDSKTGLSAQHAVSTNSPGSGLNTSAKSGGLPQALRAGIENLSGLAMDDVRVHYNSSTPAQLQASAYTQGNNIHLGPGQNKHLAHEAWHVVQQKQGRVRPTLQAFGVDINDDSGLEAEADRLGARAAQWGGVAPQVTGLANVAADGPIQRLMDREAFLQQRQQAPVQNVRLGLIAGYLETFAGLDDGNDADYQLRLRALRGLDSEIHQILGGFNSLSIDTETNGALLVQLLDESSVAHRQLVAELAGNDELLPIDTTDLEEQEAVLLLWRSIVTGAGNLRIAEKQLDFRNRMLAAIAKIMQGPGGRAMIAEINAGGVEAAKRITLSSNFTDELEGTNRDEAAKNEAIPLSDIVNLEQLQGEQAPDKAYQLNYISPEDALLLENEQINVYHGNVDDMAAFNRFLMTNDQPYIRYRNEVYRMGTGTGSYVRIQTQGSGRLVGENDQEIFTPEFVTVGHELGHARRLLKGASIPHGLSLDTLGVAAGVDQELWNLPEEFVNIKGVENMIRGEHRIDARKYHSGTATSVRGMKNFRQLSARFAVAANGIGIAGTRIAAGFPDYGAWLGLPYEQPAPDFSDVGVVRAWQERMTNIELFAPEFVRLEQADLVPELMYEDAKGKLKQLMGEDEEFDRLRKAFNLLMAVGDGANFFAKAARIGRLAKERKLGLEWEAARRTEFLLEDVDFDI